MTDREFKRYIAICALRDRATTPGERESAAARAHEMEEKYPGIADAAWRWAQESTPGQGPKPPPGPSGGGHGGGYNGGGYGGGYTAPPPHAPGWGPYDAASGNFGEGGPGYRSVPRRDWGAIFDSLGNAWNVAQQLGATLLNVNQGRTAADVVHVSETQTRTGVYKLTLSVDVQQLLYFRQSLNDAQKRAFATAVAEKVSNLVYSVLTR